MKKMTIALLTAAAMGGSSLALAADVTDPSIFGRIQYQLTDTDGSDFDGTMNSQHIGASGSASGLLGGLDASYYTRIGGDSDGTSVEYAYINVGNEAVTAQYGRNDDLVYQFVDIHLDIDRAYGGAAAAVFNGADSFRVTSDFGGSPVTIGAYANDKGDNGINEIQFAGSVDLGAVALAAAYSDSDSTGEDEFSFAANVDAGFASVRARVRETDAGTNPIALGAVAPLTPSTNLILIYGDDDADTNSKSDAYGEIRTDLGGGLDVYAGVRSGDNPTKVFLGSRWAF